MPVCFKCRSGVSKVYDCEHTDSVGYCKECYMELHHALTET